MHPWIKKCEEWLILQYQAVLKIGIGESKVRLRWLAADKLMNEVPKEQAQALAIEDSDIGWLLYLLPYEPAESICLEQQISQVLSLRSRFLRESSYTGEEEAGEQEDPDSSWRVGIVWLVEEKKWLDWQHHILEFRRESGAVEEISIDAVRFKDEAIDAGLSAHGLPRLLLHTRTLMAQSVLETETWLSADSQVFAGLEDFSQQFKTPRARTFARQLEEVAQAFQPTKRRQHSTSARQFQHFCVKQFRNLKTLEIAVDHKKSANAIILFGPNGTGKSSFAEALSLAAFGVSSRMEQFLSDKDIQYRDAQTYFKEYLNPLNNTEPQACFSWNKNKEEPFSLNIDSENIRRFEGVILNQEDSLKFTEQSREELATQVLKDYSDLADHLFTWLNQEQSRVNEIRRAFTNKYGLHSGITAHATAYDRLAQGLLREKLQRLSPEFLDWIKFLSRLSGEDGQRATQLVSAWTNQQTNVVPKLAETLAKLQTTGASHADITQALREKIDEFDALAIQSINFRNKLESRIGELRAQLDHALTQIDIWGIWLAARTKLPLAAETESQTLKIEIEALANKRSELEKAGKILRGQLDLLNQAQQFLVAHWADQHPDICPICASSVIDRQGIKAVVTLLQQETDSKIQILRNNYSELSKQQKELDIKLKAVGISICPLTIEDQVKLKDWLEPFLPKGLALEDLLVDSQHRTQFKDDLARMKFFPEAPKPYTEAAMEAQRLADNFITLSQEADQALDDPQAIEEVKKVLEKRMEEVLVDHLPATLGKVWQEITLTLTTARWLLPAIPVLKLEKRGKSLSVQLDGRDRFVRYIYNAAERHVLGLAWFFTYYLARRRFEEAWVLLDDPAQEMDQPGFRELARFWETLLRLHNRVKHPFTLVVALHQEERALDVARATNGQLYVLGWQKIQEDSSSSPSVKKIVLLAPGFHPIKPEKLFSIT